MQIEAAVVIEETRERIGNFRFSIIPRVGEEIHLPWPDYPYGTRLFIVSEVWHFAFGAPRPEFVEPMAVALIVNEIL